MSSGYYIACPRCGSQLYDDGALQGSVVMCPHCGQQFTMPIMQMPAYEHDADPALESFPTIEPRTEGRRYHNSTQSGLFDYRDVQSLPSMLVDASKGALHLAFHPIYFWLFTAPMVLGIGATLIVLNIVVQEQNELQRQIAVETPLKAQEEEEVAAVKARFEKKRQQLKESLKPYDADYEKKRSKTSDAVRASSSSARVEALRAEHEAALKAFMSASSEVRKKAEDMDRQEWEEIRQIEMRYQERYNAILEGRK